MTSQFFSKGDSGPLWIVYDGDCPFCRNYVRYLRLRQAAGEVRLVNAREGGELVGRVQREGYNLDQGMVAIVQGQVYAGEAAMHVLSLLSSRVDWFNAINHAVFSRRWAARLLYPFLRAGRRLALMWLGKKLINDDTVRTGPGR